jgi:hypothetical protein
MKKYNNVTEAKSYFTQKLKNQTIKSFYDEEKTKSDIARIRRTARERSCPGQCELVKKAD